MSAFVLLDTETTGNSKEDRLIQIAFLVAKGGENLRAVESFCKAPLPIKVDAMAVHHITEEMIENKPPFLESSAFSELEKLNSGENFLVIHNAPFDVGMLEKEGFKWRGSVIDTLRCAKHLIDSESHALQYLRYFLELYKDEDQIAENLDRTITAHDAVGDVIILYLLTQYLFKIVGKNREGIEELVRLSSQPVLIKKLRFGKHKGKSIEQVALEDPNYLEWLYKEQKKNEQKDEDMLYTLEYYLKG